MKAWRGAQSAALATWLAAASAWAQPAAEEPGSDRPTLRGGPDQAERERAAGTEEPTPASSAPNGAAASAALPAAAPAADPFGAPAPPPPPLRPQPYYDADGSLWVPGPEELPYHEGQPVPYGYETAMQRGPKAAIITGGVVLLSSYVVTVIFAAFGTGDMESSHPEYAALVPLVGPFVVAGKTGLDGSGGLFLGAGVVQLLGAGILGGGLAYSGEQRLVKRDLAEDASVYPLLPERSAGVTLRF